MRITITADSHWLVTVGNSYDVLEIDFFMSGDPEQVMFRVVSDEGDIQYISSSIVDKIHGNATRHKIVLSATYLDIPSGWVLVVCDGICSIGPPEITGLFPSFPNSVWERTFAKLCFACPGVAAAACDWTEPASE